MDLQTKKTTYKYVKRETTTTTKVLKLEKKIVYRENVRRDG